MLEAADGQQGLELATRCEFDLLLLDFYASTEDLDTDLTLFPLDIDVRQDGDGPTTTKAKFDIWNMNEVKFSGTERCITCWDQALLGNYEAPNHFLADNLQTDKGKARIDGMGSTVCPDSADTSLLGVAAKVIGFRDKDKVLGGIDTARAGMNLVGMGMQTALIQADLTATPPPEQPAGQGMPAAGASIERQLGR